MEPAMATTSLKLPEDLRKRAADAARELGVSPHAFMVQAIVQATTAAESRARLVADAEAAREAMLSSGKGYDAEEVHRYLRSRIAGEKKPRPRAKSWRS
jgi:predicted transcriptional regulator